MHDEPLEALSVTLLSIESNLHTAGVLVGKVKVIVIVDGSPTMDTSLLDGILSRLQADKPTGCHLDYETGHGREDVFMLQGPYKTDSRTSKPLDLSVVVMSHNRRKARSECIGMFMAQSEYIMFVDVGVVLDSTALLCAVEAFEKHCDIGTVRCRGRCMPYYGLARSLFSDDLFDRFIKHKIDVQTNEDLNSLPERYKMPTFWAWFFTAMPFQVGDTELKYGLNRDMSNLMGVPASCGPEKAAMYDLGLIRKFNIDIKYWQLTQEQLLHGSKLSNFLHLNTKLVEDGLLAQLVVNCTRFKSKLIGSVAYFYCHTDAFELLESSRRKINGSISCALYLLSHNMGTRLSGVRALAQSIFYIMQLWQWAAFLLLPCLVVFLTQIAIMYLKSEGLLHTDTIAYVGHILNVACIADVALWYIFCFCIPDAENRSERFEQRISPIADILSKIANMLTFAQIGFVAFVAIRAIYANDTTGLETAALVLIGFFPFIISVIQMDMSICSVYISVFVQQAIGLIFYYHMVPFYALVNMRNVSFLCLFCPIHQNDGPSISSNHLISLSLSIPHPSS
jgi:hypothetical protein